MKYGLIIELYHFKLWNDDSENGKPNHAAKKCSILFTPINYLGSPTGATHKRHLLEQLKKVHKLI
jgi:hypothetical protein